MALLFCDGFDHYATADILLKWTSGTLTGGASSVVISTVGRNSGSGARFNWGNTASPWLRMDKTLVTSGSTVIIGVALNPSSFSSNTNPVLAVFDGGVAQFSITLDVSGRIQFRRGSSNSGTVVNTSTASITNGGYCYIEAKVVLSTTVGTYDIRLNGVSVLSGSGANTAGNATTTWNSFCLGASDVAGTHVSTGTWDYDDIYVCDGSGSVNNDFLNSPRVVTVFPDGAGTTTQMTASTGSNFTCVDEASQNGDTDYVSETTVGELDTYNYAALGITGNVKGVQVNNVVRSAGSGGEQIQAMTRISGTNYAGTAQAVSTSYRDILSIFETSPATLSAWTVSEIDGAEFGQKLAS